MADVWRKDQTKPDMERKDHFQQPEQPPPAPDHQPPDHRPAGAGGRPVHLQQQPVGKPQALAVRHPKDLPAKQLPAFDLHPIIPFQGRVCAGAGD